MVNSQAITITTVLVACLISVVVFLNTGSESDGSGVRIPAQSKWTVSQDDFTQTWYLDVDAGALRIDTPHLNGLKDVLEYSRSGELSYEMLDTSNWSAEGFCIENADLDNCADVAVATQADMIAVAEEGKTHCTVADASDTFTVTNNGDSLSVGPFNVKLGADGMPTSIEGEGWSATIDSIEESDVTLSGCDTRRHTAENRDNMDIFGVIGAARRALGEPSDEVAAARATIDEIMVNLLSNSAEQRAENARKLSGMTDFMEWATGTKWCGPGTDTVATPAPTVDVEWGCYRHDHGAKYAPTLGGLLPVIGCDIDYDLFDYANRFHTNGWEADDWIKLAYGNHGFVGWTSGCTDSGRPDRELRVRAPSGCGWRGCSNYGGPYWHHFTAGEESYRGPDRYVGIVTKYGYRQRVQTWQLPGGLGAGLSNTFF